MNASFLALSVRSRLAAILFAAIPQLASAGVTIDQAPLVIAKPPPPNIMFIMDDSGSMAWQHMPGTQENWTNNPAGGLPNSAMNNDIRLRASNINTQWYDPNKTYVPWKNWDGSSWKTYNPQAENVPYDPSGEIQGGSTNLRITSYPTEPSATNRDSISRTSSTSLAFRFQGFYVYQSGSQTNNANYKRFDFRWNSSSSRWEGRYCTWNRWGTSDPYNSDCTYSINSGHNSPFGRTMAEEVQNYANWFSYYRLRASMAKAAASQVFAALGEEYRVGYNTIWNRQPLNIPVGNDDGLFRGANKEAWFKKLFDTGASDGTPLRQALNRAGQYFSSTSSAGPYGPESGAAQLSCRQNFAILTTDGYWNSNQADTAAARGNTDGTSDVIAINGPNGASYTYSAVRPYTDTQSNTLADVAMYYWKTDLRAGANGLKNDVPTSANNPAFWQHMVTFGISIGLQGSLNPETDLPALSMPANAAGAKSWPNPNDAEDSHRIDDLWHATVNSRGQFIVASDADTFVKSLTDALGEIQQRLGSGASLAANSTKLETGTRTFQAQYWSGVWRGELNAYAVNLDGSLNLTPLWQAGSQLPAHGARNIWVHDPQGGGTKYKTFTWANLGAAQQTALQSANIVAYLRGDRSNEESPGGGIYRARSGVLGDIVNSQPVYVGAPNDKLYTRSTFNGGGSEYDSFVEAQASRTPTVYVGANDGMLHGFNANTGAETFAFVPNAAIHNGLKDLSDPAYGTLDLQHRYFVDGEITVADVYIGNAGFETWRSVLVGTMGRGGRAIYALDVTNPAAPTFLWEKNATDIPDLGNVLGKPVIAQIANGDWRVLLGNGPNGANDDAKLIMIDIRTGNVTTVATGATGNNGLTSAYTWDTNRDGFVDRIYAGDLRGNLWRISNLATTPTVLKLFEARDPTNNRQPITAAPIAARDPATGFLWVFFGTGQYLNDDDLDDDQVQTWYAVIDRSALVTKSNMVSRGILAEGEINGFGARVIDTGGPADLLGRDGWYMDLVSPDGAEGERMVVPNQLQGQVLIGATRIPEAIDRCNPSGRGFVMAVAPFTGARLPETFFDITRDGDFNDDDKLSVGGVLTIISGIGFTASPNNPIFIENSMQVSLDDGSTRSINTQGSGATAIRQSWRELIQ